MSGFDFTHPIDDLFTKSAVSGDQVPKKAKQENQESDQYQYRREDQGLNVPLPLADSKEVQEAEDKDPTCCKRERTEGEEGA